MSTHLRTEDFVDALDGNLDAARRAHLDACPTCRGEILQLRAVLADVKPAGEVPEPSPLFWDHFSTRVREATAEVQPEAASPWWMPVWRPIAALGIAASVVALVVFNIGSTVDRSAPLQQQASVEPVAVDSAPEDLESSLAFVSAAASELSFDEARAVDLAPAPRIIESAIERLTNAQRAELVKLIREDLRSMD
jgi:hypothetical protein